MPRDFDRSVLDQVAHRPWPMPSAPWVMTQTWNDLLFVHWPVDPAQLRPTIPPPFALDVFAGFAWLTIVAFHMTNVAPRGAPTVPWVSAFPELNVRTYVRAGNRPGIFFYSLDAGSAVAVRGARLLLNLPYYFASMSVDIQGDGIAYRSVRSGDRSAAFSARYAPAGLPHQAAPGTLEYFLTERYCLYHIDRWGTPYRLDIHHVPWALQPVAVEILRNTMADANGIVLPDEAPICSYVRRQDMVGWGPTW